MRHFPTSTTIFPLIGASVSVAGTLAGSGCASTANFRFLAQRQRLAQLLEGRSGPLVGLGDAGMNGNSCLHGLNNGARKRRLTPVYLGSKTRKINEGEEPLFGPQFTPPYDNLLMAGSRDGVASLTASSNVRCLGLKQLQSQLDGCCSIVVVIAHTCV